LVEFALVVPLFFILLFGIIDIGRLYSIQLTIQNALRQAGRFAVTGNQVTQGTNTLSRVNSIKQVARDASGGLLTLTGIQVSSTPSGGGATIPNNAGGPGDVVTVSVTYNLQLLTPLISQFFAGGVYQINASTTFKSEPFPPPS
jgi:Flp pilus assembly protein TadG